MTWTRAEQTSTTNLEMDGHNMQINTSATLPNAAAEPAAGGTDHVENGSAGSFFAQMDQIWSAKTGQDISPKNPDEKASTKAEGDPLTMLMLASLIPGKMEAPTPIPISPGSVGNESSKSVSAPQTDVPCLACDQTLIPVSGNSEDEKALSHALALTGNKRPKNAASNTQINASATVSSTATKPATGGKDQVQDGSASSLFAQTDQILNVKTAQDISGENPDEKTSTKAAAGTPADFCFYPGSDPDVQSVSKSQGSFVRFKMTDNKLQAESPVLPQVQDRQATQTLNRTEAGGKSAVESVKNTGKSVVENLENVAKDSFEMDSNSGPQESSEVRDIISKTHSPSGKAEIDAGSKESALSSFTVDREALQVAAEPVRQTAASELRQGVLSRFEYDPSPESLGATVSLPISDKPPARQDVPQAVIPGKLEDIAQETLENAGAGNNSAGQESQSKDPSSWTIPQTRQDNTRGDSPKSWIQLTEQQHDASAQPVSGSVHSTSNESTVISTRPEVASSQPKEFISQLAGRMQVLLQDGKEEIRIQLKPDSLGHLEIRAESTTDGVVARIVAESSNVRNYLESNLHLLHQSLLDQGLKVDRIQVTIQNGSDSQSFSGHAAQSGNSGSGYHGRGTGRPSDISANEPDELSVDPITWIALNHNVHFHTIA